MFGTIRRRGSRPVLGLLVCALLVFFAVEAKLSLYAPQQKNMKVLSATKVWQGEAERSIPTPPVSQQLLVATVFLLLLRFAVSSEEVAFVTEPRMTTFEWFSPDLFVRPPPTL